MNSAASPNAIPPPTPARSTFVTVLAWVVIVLSALALPISGITCLMIIAKSYGTQTSDLLGFFQIVILPPVCLVIGIGLLRRRWRAWFCFVALLFVMAAICLFQVVRGPGPEKVSYSPSGVKTTVMATSTESAQTGLLLWAALIAWMLSPHVKAEFGASRKASPLPGMERRWRVGHRGRDSMHYEEWRDGTWQRLDIDGEMLMGRAHHVIYFATPERWQSYPEWARHRRDEIIARIKSEFREPDYEYHGDGPQGQPQPPGSLASSPGATSSAVPVPNVSVAQRQPSVIPNDKPEPLKRQAALWLVIVLFISLACGMFWLVNDGLGKGETFFPGKHASQRRSVSRAQEPATFWLSIGLYVAIGLGSSGFALWLIREGCRLRHKGR